MISIYVLRRLLTGVFALLLSLPVMAQSPSPKTDSPKTEVAKPKTPKESFGDIPLSDPVKPDVPLGKFSTVSESLRTILVLAFGVITLVIASILISKHAQDINSLFKYFIIILVIIGAIVLLSIGYDKEQIAPTIGLFGTIAGYLLGKTDQPVNRNPPPSNPAPDPNANPTPQP